jgi:hypothetical protein
MERLWITLAGYFALAAIVLLWFRRFDGVFVCGVLGILAWFMNKRDRLKKDAFRIENTSKSETETNESGDRDEG